MVIVQKTESNTVKIKPPELEKLAEFCAQWNTYKPLAAENALFFDPWDIAGLARKEVQNTAVLAWLLNPRGSHGFGDIMINALMARLSLHPASKLPSRVGQTCRVRVEQSPLGDTSNRVDLEIEDEKFYLLIEVKIDAKEKEGQLDRYAKDAEFRVGDREGAVLFLTPHGCMGSVTKNPKGKIGHIAMSWSELSHLLNPALREYRQKQKNKLPQQHMAEQAAACFINRMTKF